MKSGTTELVALGETCSRAALSNRGWPCIRLLESEQINMHGIKRAQVEIKGQIDLKIENWNLQFINAILLAVWRESWSSFWDKIGYRIKDLIFKRKYL
jgi:hypothetical protein